MTRGLIVVLIGGLVAAVLTATAPVPAGAQEAGTTEETAIDVCAAGRRGGASMGLAIPQQEESWATIIVPPRTRLVMTATDSKADTTTGNWAAELEAFLRKEDGSISGRDMSAKWASPYRWTQTEYEREVGFPNESATLTHRYYLKLSTIVVVGVDDSEGARIGIGEFKFENLDTGETVPYDCSGSTEIRNLDRCVANGGQFYFAEKVTIDGVDYQGCIAHAGCVSQLPSVLGAVAEWSCENNDMLVKATIAAGAVAIVLATGVVIVYVGGGVVAGSAARTALRLGVRLGVERGATQALPAMKIGGTAATVAAAMLLLERQAQLALDVNPRLIADVTESDDWISANKSAQRGMSRQDFKRASQVVVATCVATISLRLVRSNLDTLGIPASRFNRKSGMVTVPGKEPRHVCDYIPAYFPGGTSVGGKRIVASTLHIGDVLYGTSNGEGINSPANTAIGAQPQWMLLTKTDNPEHTTNRKWYQRGPYKCERNGLDCDEFPFYTTKEGGPVGPGRKAAPRAHLRLIGPAENRTGGADFSGFITACKVKDDEMFLIVPQIAPLVESRTPSLRSCEGRR